MASAAAGRLDALITVAGMFVGALVFLLVDPLIMPGLRSTLNYGKTTLPALTGTDAAVWVLPMFGVGAVVLWLTRPRGG